MGELAGCPLLCFDVKNPVAFPDSKLWLSITPGDNLITLDAPFVLHLPESYDGLGKQDDWQLPCGGVKVAYVLQYHLDETRGMLFKKGGLVFLQRMGAGRHWAQLATLAAVMEKKMALFGSQIACRQANKMHSTGSTGI